MGSMAILWEQQTLDALGPPWGQREVSEGSQKCRLSWTRDKLRLLEGRAGPGHKRWSVSVGHTRESSAWGSQRMCGGQ